MEPSEYLDFSDRVQVRLRGHRIGLETILEDYLAGMTAEELCWRYRTLDLDEVRGVISYYLRHQDEVDGYLAACRVRDEDAIRRYEDEHPPRRYRRGRPAVATSGAHAR